MRASPLKIAFLYLFFSIAWVVSSDYLVYQLAVLIDIPVHMLQTGKGTFFIIITALLLYLIIKKHHQSLKDSEKQYKALFYSNPNPLWIYDLSTLKFLAVNDAAIHSYGYSRREFQSMTIKDIRPVEDHKKLVDAVKNTPAGTHISGYWRHMDKSGKIFTVSIESHKINFNGRECDMVMVQDVTARLEQEEQLKKAYQAEKQLKEELEKSIALLRQQAEENRMLADVVQRINNVVIITDIHGVITWVNQAFTDITGYSSSEAIGQYTSMLHGPKTKPEIQRLIMESIQRKEFCRFEILNYTKSGQEYWIDLSISAIYNEKNEVERYISIQNSITERKEKEAKISSQNEALRQIAWTNSHALRKPVASIMSLTALSKDVKRLKEMKEIHSLIEECSRELDESIKEVTRQINHIESHTSH